MTRGAMSAFGVFLHRKREGDVVRHAHVREQRVVLEHHADIALVGRQPIDRLAGERDDALARPFEAREHVQGRGLAGAGRPEERQELAAADGQIQPSDGLKVAIHFLDVDEFDELWSLRLSLAGSLAIARPPSGGGPRAAPLNCRDDGEATFAPSRSRRASPNFAWSRPSPHLETVGVAIVVPNYMTIQLPLSDAIAG